MRGLHLSCRIVLPNPAAKSHPGVVEPSRRTSRTALSLSSILMTRQVPYLQLMHQLEHIVCDRLSRDSAKPSLFVFDILVGWHSWRPCIRKVASYSTRSCTTMNSAIQPQCHTSNLQSGHRSSEGLRHVSSLYNLRPRAESPTHVDLMQPISRCII